MNLFNQDALIENNLLPIDGVVHYYGKIWSSTKADSYFQALLNNIEWQHDEVIIFGKKIITKRKVAWYGSEPYEYTYSKIAKQALLWTAPLIEIKERIEALSGETFNACLLNLYHTGEEGMGWHSDAEHTLVKEGAIASISFGAERKFLFKHKATKVKVSVLLQHGSLLIMKGSTQTHWQHRLPLSKTILAPRINLTFRSML